jgi:CheY-like chemotaxis protein
VVAQGIETAARGGERMTERHRSNQVLVVSADANQSAQYREVLEGEGFSVQVAQRRAEARDLLAHAPIDVLILDVFLEDGPAYALFAEAKLEGVLVVGLTGVLQGPTVRAMLLEQYPFVDLLDRPLQAAHLIDLLRVHLGDRYPVPPVISQVNEDEQATFDQEFFARKRIKTSHFHALDPSPNSHLGQREASGRLSVAGLGAVRAGGGKPPPVPDVPLGLNWRKIRDEGELSVIGFAALMTRLLRFQSSGALRLWRAKVRKVVFFAGGVPTGVRSNLLYECLGRILVRDGWITETVCEQAVRESQRTGARLGQTLVEQGHLAPQQLEQVLGAQLRSRILDIFSWDHAQYHWSADEATPEGTVTLAPEQVTRLILQGVLQHTPLARITRDLSGQLHQQVKPLQGLEAAEVLRLDEGQRAVWDAIQQREQGTLLELIARFDESAPTYAMVYALASLGYLGFTKG